MNDEYMKDKSSGYVLYHEKICRLFGCGAGI